MRYRCPICKQIHEKEEIIFGKKQRKMWKYDGITLERNYNFMCKECYEKLKNDPNEIKFRFYDRLERREKLEKIWKYVLLIPVLYYIILICSFILGLIHQPICQSIGSFVINCYKPVFNLYQVNYPFAWIFANITFAITFLVSFVNYRSVQAKVFSILIVAFLITGIFNVDILNGFLNIFRWVVGFLILGAIGNASGSDSNGDYTNESSNDSYNYSANQSSSTVEESKRNQYERNESERKRLQEQREEQERKIKQRKEKDHTIAYVKETGSSVQVLNAGRVTIFTRPGKLEGYTGSSVTVSQKSGSITTYKVYDNYGRQISSYTKY